MNKHFPSEIPKAQPKAASKKDIYTTMTKRQNKFEDTKGVIRIQNGQKDKERSTIILHRKLTIEQDEPL